MAISADDRWEMRAIWTLAFLSAAGMAAIVLQACASNSGFISTFSVGLLIAGAAWLGGGLLGVLFGVPIQREDPSKPVQGNTSLEHVSEWVTKIVVGIGLVEFTKIMKLLQDFGQFAKVGLGNTEAGAVVAQAALIHFAICGFLIAFLWTRIHLGQVIMSVEDELKDFRKRQETEDAAAWSLVERQLYADEPEEVGQQDLNKAIATASGTAKIQIFMATAQAHEDNWHRGATDRIERTISIYRALANDDPENIYHRNHAHLGYALKDQTKPDYAEALKELSTAIQMRDRLNEDGWKIYEFNRAICRIHLGGRAGDILADLKAAAQTVKKKIQDCEELVKSELPKTKEAAASAADRLLSEIIPGPKEKEDRRLFENRVIGLWLASQEKTFKDILTP